MTFIRSILLLGGVVASVSFAIFVGHALSTHHMEPVYLGLVALAVGAVLLFVYNRMGRGEGATQGH